MKNHDHLVVMASINDLVNINGVGGFEEVLRLVHLKLHELQTGETPSLLGKVEKDDSSNP